MNQSADRKTCDSKATYRFTWPGQDESFICEHHATWLKRVAKAMGLHLQVAQLGDDVDEICQQTEPA